MAAPDPRHPAPVLMVLGTTSDAGKSVLVTALCRIFRQDGVRVAPFKAQNMSNNADVTADGGEIGRAQSEQAAAAGIAPTTAMNPVLLKPQGDRTSQVIVDGRADGLLRSRDFIERKRDLWPHVERALASLRDEYDLVVAEGAGSPAEPNLRAGDIVNMRVALHAGATVLLVGDIDRGGVFAHLVGTMALLTPEERALVRGFVINRFRGDASLLAPAIEDLERRTGVPVLGVIPWLPDLRVAQEDAVVLERAAARDATHEAAEAGEVDIAIARLPRIANFDDFDPLAAEPGVRVRYVARAEDLGTPSLIILPGTKATIADLAVLRASGLAQAIVERARAGTPVLGICGGFQMLGERLADPLGVEAAAGTEVAGLGLLPIATTFAAEKVTRRASGVVRASIGPWAAQGAAVEGYEIHMGRTEGIDGARLAPLLRLGSSDDGAVSGDGRVAGCYLHGLFHNTALRHALLSALGWDARGAVTFDREREFDRLAQHVRSHLDIERVRAMVLGGTRRAMGELLLVTGGARSGKSRFAERIAIASGRGVTYVATMEALDDEVRARIARHRAERPVAWTTVEAPLAIVEAVRAAAPDDCVLLDCLSLWASNRLLALGEGAGIEALADLERTLEAGVEALHAVTRERAGDVILVTNEVGGGLVPEHALGRAYRDLLGRVNQRASLLAARAWLLVAGRALPLPPPDAPLDVPLT